MHKLVLSVVESCFSLAGALKSVQFFSRVWLPGAMEVPTPALSLIHSATLVIADVLSIIRFISIFEFTTTVNCLLIVLGSLTLSFGSLVASAQYDIKKLVAYSTISQVGYLICGCGFCCYEEVFIYLVLHAINKAFLFILVGYIVHFFLGNTDMRHMGGVYNYMFDLTIFLFMTAFNLTGLPYSAGYVGKEFLVFHMIRDDILALFARSAIMVSLFFTPVYMHVLVFIVMFGPKRGFIGAYSSHWRGSTLRQNSLEYGRRKVTSQPDDGIRYWVETTTSVPAQWFIYNRHKSNLTPYSGLSLSQQTTLATSRFVAYILLTYYIIFALFGEVFLLTSLGLTTSVDFIQSPNFFSIKSYIFLTNMSSTSFTLTQFTFIVQVLSLFGFVWLLLFNTHNSVNYLRLNFITLAILLLNTLTYIYFTL